MLTHLGGSQRRPERASSCWLLSLITPPISTPLWVPEPDSADYPTLPSGLTLLVRILHSPVAEMHCHTLARAWG